MIIAFIGNNGTGKTTIAKEEDEMKIVSVIKPSQWCFEPNSFSCIEYVFKIKELSLPTP